MTSLEIAIRANDTATAIALLHAGRDVNGRNSDGFTMLMVAAGLGHREMVSILLAAGADVLTMEPRMGTGVLHKAAQSGNADLVELLLDQGAIVDQQSARLGNTPLMDAVLHKHDAVVALLLARGARADITNHWHQTALQLARRYGLDAIACRIEARLQALADATEASPLLAAVRDGDTNAVRRLVAAGADIEERTPVNGSVDDDYTPLGLAAQKGHVGIVELLLVAGADPRRRVGLMEGTPGHEAAYAGHADVIRALTRDRGPASPHQLDIDAQGAYNGFSALHDAIWRGRLEAARALIEAGARRDLATHAGLTPKELARLYGYDAIARLLEDGGD